MVRWCEFFFFWEIFFILLWTRVPICSASGSMCACHAAAPGSIFDARRMQNFYLYMSEELDDFQSALVTTTTCWLVGNRLRYFLTAILNLGKKKLWCTVQKLLEVALHGQTFSADCQSSLLYYRSWPPGRLDDISNRALWINKVQIKKLKIKINKTSVKRTSMYLFCYKYNELRSWADIGKHKIILWVPCHITHQNIKLLDTLNNLLGFDIFALMNYKTENVHILEFWPDFLSLAVWAFSRWWKAFGTLLVGLLEVADSLIVLTLRMNCIYFPKETAPSIRKCSGTDQGG